MAEPRSGDVGSSASSRVSRKAATPTCSSSSAAWLHDLAWVVVVAQAAGPGGEDPDRRAPGGPGGSAVRRFGALAQGRGDQLGRKPVPYSQRGPGWHRIGADAVLASVLAVGHRRRRRARRGLCRGQEPECPAGGGRSHGRRGRMGAGGCGEGHRRPPPTVCSAARTGQRTATRPPRKSEPQVTRVRPEPRASVRLRPAPARAS